MKNVHLYVLRKVLEEILLDADWTKKDCCKLSTLPFQLMQGQLTKKPNSTFNKSYLSVATLSIQTE